MTDPTPNPFGTPERLELLAELRELVGKANSLMAAACDLWDLMEHFVDVEELQEAEELEEARVERLGLFGGAVVVDVHRRVDGRPSRVFRD